tara:strand:- start:3838 stop:4965 length:1128 start_codon:yes stop_codon:yes gene_type:complete
MGFIQIIKNFLDGYRNTISSFISKLNNIFEWFGIIINFISSSNLKILIALRLIPGIFVLLFYIYALILLFLAIINIIFGVNIDISSFILSSNILYVLYSIIKYVLYVFLFISVFFFSFKNIVNTSNNNDEEPHIIISLIKLILQNAYIIIMIMTIIIGNGILGGLYELSCSGKKTNLASFVYSPNNIMNIFLILSTVCIIICKILNISKKDSNYLQTPLLLLCLIYIIFLVSINGIEKIISNNFYSILKGENNESNYDCYEEGCQQNNDWFNVIGSILFAIVLWPLMGIIIVIQLRFFKTEENMINIINIFFGDILTALFPNGITDTTANSSGIKTGTILTTKTDHSVEITKNMKKKLMEEAKKFLKSKKKMRNK